MTDLVAYAKFDEAKKDSIVDVSTRYLFHDNNKITGYHIIAQFDPDLHIEQVWLTCFLLFGLLIWATPLLITWKKVFVTNHFDPDDLAHAVLHDQYLFWYSCIYLQLFKKKKHIFESACE